MGKGEGVKSQDGAGAVDLLESVGHACPTAQSVEESLAREEIERATLSAARRCDADFRCKRDF